MWCQAVLAGPHGRAWPRHDPRLCYSIDYPDASVGESSALRTVLACTGARRPSQQAASPRRGGEAGAKREAAARGCPAEQRNGRASNPTRTYRLCAAAAASLITARWWRWHAFRWAEIELRACALKTVYTLEQQAELTTTDLMCGCVHVSFLCAQYCNSECFFCFFQTEESTRPTVYRSQGSRNEASVSTNS